MSKGLNPFQAQERIHSGFFTSNQDRRRTTAVVEDGFQIRDNTNLHMNGLWSLTPSGQSSANNLPGQKLILGETPNYTNTRIHKY